MSSLEKAKQGDLLSNTYDAATRVIAQGNQLMHNHMADEKVLRALARDSIQLFTEAAVELLGGSAIH